VALVAVGYPALNGPAPSVRSPPSTEATAGPPVIAVLPLSAVGGDSAQRDLGVAVADLLVGALARVPGINVLSPSATRTPDDEDADLLKLARDLGASHVVEGTLQQADGRTRFTLTLLQPKSHLVVWSGSYDGPTEDLLGMQQRAAHELVEALSPGAADRASGEAARPTTSVEAFAEYMQARSFLHRADQAGNVERAARLFESAIRRDPGFALAHAGLAEAYWSRYRETEEEGWTLKAREAAFEALRLDPELPGVRYSLAVILQGTGKVPEAIEELRRVVALQPSNDDAHRRLGRLLADQGRDDEAIGELQRAVALRPNFWDNHQALGWAYFRSGRFPAAARAYTRVTELQPDNAWGFQMLGTAYHASGDKAKAAENYRKAIAIGPGARAYSNLGTILYEQGRFDEAVETYREAARLEPNAAKYRNLGDAYAKLGQRAQSREAYAQAVELCRKRLTVNPRDALTLAKLAVYEAKLGLDTEAQGHAERAATLAPEDPGVLYRRAVVHALAGRAGAALEVLGDALNAGYSAAFAGTDEDLEALRGRAAFAALLAEHRRAVTSKGEKE